jgi:hypothetical protein
MWYETKVCNVIEILRIQYIEVVVVVVVVVSFYLAVTEKMYSYIMKE